MTRPRATDADKLRAAHSAVRALQVRAHAHNVARAGRMAGALNALAHDELDDAHRLQAVELAHQISGSAGTFGFPYTSELAGQLEEFFIAGNFGRRELVQAGRWLVALELDLAGEPDLDEGDVEPW